MSVVRTCLVCPNPITSTNPRARYCSSTCRARRSKGVVTVLPGRDDVDQERDEPPVDGPVAAATLRELVEAERDDTALGQSALALARRIDMGVDTGSALASAAARHAELLAAATRGARRQETELDRVRRQRDEKRHA